MWHDNDGGEDVFYKTRRTHEASKNTEKDLNNDQK